MYKRIQHNRTHNINFKEKLINHWVIVLYMSY